jgi:hypothetical protein
MAPGQQNILLLLQEVYNAITLLKDLIERVTELKWSSKSGQ